VSFDFSTTAGQIYRRSKNLDNWTLLPLAIPVLFILIFLLLPVIQLFLISFFEYHPFEGYIETFTLENYQRFVGDPFYREFIYYTVRVSLITTLFCIVLGYPVGYYLARTSPMKRKIVLFVTVLPLMVGVVVRTYGWIILLGANGIINKGLITIGLGEYTLLNTTAAVIIGLVGVLLPFLVLPVYSSLNNIPPMLELAARDLGANQAEAFLKITLPLSIPGIISGSIFTFTLSMSAVVTPQLLGGRSDITVGRLMYATALSDLNWPFASAMAASMALLTFILIYVYLKYSRGQFAEVE
jgi:ABC-type spermidine/putrescine transport system permease subunit I